MDRAISKSKLKTTKDVRNSSTNSDVRHKNGSSRVNKAQQLNQYSVGPTIPDHIATLTSYPQTPNCLVPILVPQRSQTSDILTAAPRASGANLSGAPSHLLNSHHPHHHQLVQQPQPGHSICPVTNLTGNKTHHIAYRSKEGHMNHAHGSGPNAQHVNKSKSVSPKNSNSNNLNNVDYSFRANPNLMLRKDSMGSFCLQKAHPQHPSQVKHALPNQPRYSTQSSCTSFPKKKPTSSEEAVFNRIKNGQSFNLDKLRKSLFKSCTNKTYPKLTYQSKIQVTPPDQITTHNLHHGYGKGHSHITSGKHPHTHAHLTSSEREKLQALEQQESKTAVFWTFYSESPMIKQFTLEYILNIIPCDPIIVRTFVEKTKQQIFENYYNCVKDLLPEKFKKIRDRQGSESGNLDLGPSGSGPLGLSQDATSANALEYCNDVSADVLSAIFDLEYEKVNKRLGPDTFLHICDLIIYVFQNQTNGNFLKMHTYYNMIKQTVLALDSLTKSENDYLFTSEVSLKDFEDWYKTDIVKIFNDTFQMFTYFFRDNNKCVIYMEQFMYSYLALISFVLDSSQIIREEGNPNKDNWTYRPVSLAKPKHFFMFCDKILVQLLKNFDKFRYEKFDKEKAVHDDRTSLHAELDRDPPSYDRHHQYNTSDIIPGLGHKRAPSGHSAQDYYAALSDTDSDETDSADSLGTNPNNSRMPSGSRQYDYGDSRHSQRDYLDQRDISYGDDDRNDPPHFPTHVRDSSMISHEALNQDWLDENNNFCNSNNNNNNNNNRIDQKALLNCSPYRRKLEAYLNILNDVNVKLREQERDGYEDGYEAEKEAENIIQNLYNVFKDVHSEMCDILDYY